MSSQCHNMLNISGSEKDIDEIYRRARLQIDNYSFSALNVFYGLVDQDIFYSRANILDTLAGDNDKWSVILEHIARIVGFKYKYGAFEFEDNYALRIFDLTEERYPGGIILMFDSDWQPGYLVMTYLLKRFPAVSMEMTYEESSSGCYGKATYNTGYKDLKEYKNIDCSASTCIKNDEEIYDFIVNCFESNKTILSYAEIEKRAVMYFDIHGCMNCPLQNDQERCAIMLTEFFEEAVMPKEQDSVLKKCYDTYLKRHSYNGYQKVRDENKLGKAMVRGKSLKTGEYIDGYKYEEYPYVCITKPGETYNNRVFIVYQVNMDWNLSTSNMEEVDPATVEPVTGYHGKTLSYYMNLPYSYTIEHIKEEDGGGIMLRVPLLKGCMTDGGTIEEAVQNLKDAKKTWLAFAIERGAEIPEPEATING